VSVAAAGSNCGRPAERHDPTFPKEAVFGTVRQHGCRILRIMSRTSRRRQASFSGQSPPRKPKNVDVRPREYLSEEEVGRLIQAAKGVGRYGHRSRGAALLLTYRHGLRVSEVIALQWAVVDLKRSSPARPSLEGRHPCGSSLAWPRDSRHSGGWSASHPARPMCSSANVAAR
jgi:integrase